MDNEEDISSQTTTEKSSTQDESKTAEMKEEVNYKIEDIHNSDNKALETKKVETNLGITLNSLQEHWAYQNILLDYNILDFTSK